MATVCGASLALFDAGIALKGAVAGVAMDWSRRADDYAILTDIAGAEDHYGDMDFKWPEPARASPALQMDIKIGGLTREILEKAMEQARQGRLFLLDKMDAVLDGPRTERSAYAPRIETVMIPTDKIRDLIARAAPPFVASSSRPAQDRCGRHGPGQCFFLRCRGPEEGARNHRQPHRGARGRQGLSGQGGSPGGVWRFCRALPRNRRFAAHLRDCRAPRQGSEG